MTDMLASEVAILRARVAFLEERLAEAYRVIAFAKRLVAEAAYLLVAVVAFVRSCAFPSRRRNPPPVTKD